MMEKTIQRRRFLGKLGAILGGLLALPASQHPPRLALVVGTSADGAASGDIGAAAIADTTGRARADTEAMGAPAATRRGTIPRLRGNNAGPPVLRGARRR